MQRQVLLHQDESGVWIVEVPFLPGCLSQGQTRDEALRNIRHAIEAWLEVAQQFGDEIPEEAQLEIATVELP